MAALEIQANQLGLQAAQDCERMAKDRTLTLQMLQKVENIFFISIFPISVFNTKKLKSLLLKEIFKKFTSRMKMSW